MTVLLLLAAWLILSIPVALLAARMMAVQPSREEVVAALREKYQTGGYEALTPFLEHVQRYGQVHAPDWIVCADCGVEVEVEPNGPTTHQPNRCSACITDRKARWHIESRMKNRRPHEI